MIIIDNTYELEQVVYLKTDTQQLPRVVYCIEVYKGNLIYGLAQGAGISKHYEFEMTEDKTHTI